jgi:peptidyl-prolyl cis-trans isomerase D
MLQGMRKAGQGLIGKIVIAVLFGFLILSFAVWGIGDIFRGYGRNTVATVGKIEISSDTMRNAYQTEVQNLSRQFRQQITPDRARAFGIDTQVFNRLVNEAAIDQRASRLGLNISNEKVVQSITQAPAFQNLAGQFDRARFDDILRNYGYTEATFVRDQRAQLIRQQLLDALTGGFAPPLVVREAAFRHAAERRSASYFILPAASAGTIEPPDEATLKTYFEERKSSFRAPEYRKLVVLAATPATLARPDEVSDSEARERYEKDKASKYGSAEKRKLQQMSFVSQEEAQAASEKLKGGATFEDIAKERNLNPKDFEIGTLAKAEVIDPAVRDAAFALPLGGTSAPVASRFGPIIVRVDAIDPESVKLFEEVVGAVKRDIATEKARTRVADLHDKIEDQRAAAKSLQQIAPELGLPLRSVEAIDKNGHDKSDKPIEDLPEQTALLRAAFASDVGADNEAIRSGDNGYVWFDVAGVEPTRDRELDEVREAVVSAWRSDETARRLAAKAREFVARLGKGEAFAAVAADAGQEVKTADGLSRGASKGDLPVEAVTQIFGTFSGKAGTVALDEGENRVVFQVTSATMPPFDPKSPDVARFDEQLRTGMIEDLRSEYTRQVQTELGITVNQQALKTALGGSADN